MFQVPGRLQQKVRMGLTKWGEFLGRRRRRRRHLENAQILGNVHFFTNGHVQKIQKCKFLEKKPPEAQRRTELPQKKQRMP